MSRSKEQIRGEFERIRSLYVEKFKESLDISLLVTELAKQRVELKRKFILNNIGHYGLEDTSSLLELASEKIIDGTIKIKETMAQRKETKTRGRPKQAGDTKIQSNKPLEPK